MKQYIPLYEEFINEMMSFTPNFRKPTKKYISLTVEKFKQLYANKIKNIIDEAFDSIKKSKTFKFDNYFAANINGTEIILDPKTNWHLIDDIYQIALNDANKYKHDISIDFAINLDWYKHYSYGLSLGIYLEMDGNIYLEIWKDASPTDAGGNQPDIYSLNSNGIIYKKGLIDIMLFDLNNMLEDEDEKD